MIDTTTKETEKLTYELDEVREKQRGLKICKRKLLDKSFEEPSEKESRLDSLPKKSSDTSKSPKKKRKQSVTRTD